MSIPETRGRSKAQTVAVELDFATWEQLRWLQEHGNFESEKAVIEAGIRALSRNYEQLDSERRYREELAQQTRIRSHDLG